jgi:hypothetical protein
LPVAMFSAIAAVEQERFLQHEANLTPHVLQTQSHDSRCRQMVMAPASGS